MATAILMPKSGPTVESCVIGSWEKKVGEEVKTGDILFTYETDKTSYECIAREDGILLEVFFEEGDEVPVLTPVCAVGKAGEDCASFALDTAASVEAESSEDAGGSNGVFVYADEKKHNAVSPRARRFAEREGIDASFITGTGPNGRIIELDVKKFIESSAANTVSKEHEDVKFSGIRRTISKTMHTSLSSMAQITHNNSFDASEILAYRKRLKAMQDENSGITLGDIVLYVVSRVLLKHPDFNANALENGSIRRFKSVNLGVAVDTPRGLMVPTIFGADKKSLLQISKEVKTLAAQCRDGSISPEKLTGGSFTVTNLGSMGVESFTPIINPPQTGILGVCCTTERVKKMADGSLGTYPAMVMSLTYDHRVIDGTPAARFQKDLGDALENFNEFLSETKKHPFKRAAEGAYDLLVVGGGPGGYLCAERAAQNGMKVMLFEKKALGGTCLNEGCIPTKTLLNSAKMYRHAKEGENFGVTAENVSYNHERVVERKTDVVKTLVSGVGAAMRANKVTIVNSIASIKGKNEKGFVVTADGKEYEGTRLVIATGSETVIPPINGLKEALECGFAVTSREILDEKKIPENLVVIGGGVIGLEMAYYFASVGSKVTVIEAMPKIAGDTDSDICKVLTDSFNERGMEFKLSSRVLEVKKNGIVYEENGETKEIICDKVLVCAGRKPKTDGFGIEMLGLEMDRSAFKTDAFLCTSVEDVYAIGDCNGKSMLAHTAYREAEVAVNHMIGKYDKMRYNVVPSVIYTDPEVASVGLSKKEAEEKGIKAKEIKLPLSYAGRYVAETENGKGFIKIVADMEKNTLVGCHVVGSYASEIIMTATMMIDTEINVERLKKLVFPHPTVSEIVREAIFKL